MLATLLPELPARLGAQPATYLLPPEQARLRLYEALGQLLADIARPRGLLLILDDLHWVDPATLDLLCFTARRQPGARLAMLCAQRAGEADHPSELERATTELERLRVLHPIALIPLDAVSIDALANRVLGGPVDARLARRLFAQSEGNPFFAEELLRDWTETGRIARRVERWALIERGTAPPPTSIRRAIHQRLERVPPAVRELLQTAAIIGRRFDTALLASAAGEEPEPVELLLVTGAATGLIESDGPDGYRFTHDMIRESLYEQSTPTRRRRVHGFIGQAIEQDQERDASPRRLADLAFHFARSGDRERGAAYAIAAAEQAMRMFAPEEAMAHYQTALDLIAAGDARRGDLLLASGEAASLAGDERAAVTALAAARAALEARGDRAGAARSAHRLGQAWWRQEAIADARTAFDDALRLLPEAAAERVPVLVDRAGLLGGSLHQYAAGIADARQALALADALNDTALQAKASRALGNLLARTGELDTGIALLERALQLATEQDDPVDAAECCACLAPAFFWLGQMRRSREITRRRLHFAERSHDPYQFRHIATWLAMVDAIQGRMPESDAWLRQAEIAVASLASPEPMAWIRFVRGASALFTGAYAESKQHLEAAIAAFRAMGPGTLIWHIGMLGLLQASSGDRTGAEATTRELEALIADLPDQSAVPPEPLGYLASLALALDDVALQQRVRPRLHAWRGRFADFLIDRLIGEIALRAGDIPDARASLQAAETTARREHLPWELAATLRAQATLTVAMRGERAAAEAVNLLEEALALVLNSGNEHLAAALEREIARVKKAPETRPAGLSRREIDVLQRVAAGMSNRQIAADLFLSEKTIESHLTSIFTKLGVDNRAAATAFAVRHELG